MAKINILNWSFILRMISNISQFELSLVKFLFHKMKSLLTMLFYKNYSHRNLLSYNDT